MKGWFAWLIILVLVAGTLWYAVTGQGNPTPTITVTSPVGGESWESGTTHTITWTSTGVPKTDHIAISIRRIPPPPLPEEGQEFDPLIITDAPNTGSYAWTIAGMYPSGTYVLGVSSHASVPVTKSTDAESAPFTITHPTLSQDLYPLYAQASWSAPTAETVTIGTTTLDGASITSAPVTDTMNPGAIFTPFERYYDQKLRASGWTIANELAAGGHVGGQTGYHKGDATILTRFHIDYHTVSSTSPSECPCDVTLSLFSTE